jgi:hypothetical protein
MPGLIPSVEFLRTEHKKWAHEIGDQIVVKVSAHTGRHTEKVIPSGIWTRVSDVGDV